MMPALLTRISMEPNCWTVSSTKRAQTAASPTSPTSAADLTPRAWSFCCVATGAELEPSAATFAPASAKAVAIAAPNPRDEPVTRADLPLRLKLSSIVLWEVRGLSFLSGRGRAAILPVFIIGERNGEGWRPGEIYREARFIRRPRWPPRCTILQRTLNRTRD